MPSTGSWNGQWSGAGRNYVRVRRVDAKRADELAAGRWYHNWTDGWSALVTARIMERGERATKSDGFAGYDWMIDNIIRHGSTSDPADA
jgi:hypothetical protein